jgi:hypothetical protein
MRAYHRVDPLMDERKGHYTPAQFGAFLKVQLLAGRQTARGRFRSIAALRGLLPAAYVKHVEFLLAEGDLDVLEDGTVYVDGWNEWQEGDLTVRDRMAALRNRRRNSTVTGTVTPAVTEPSPPATRSSVGVGVGVGESPDGGSTARDPANTYWTLTGKYPVGNSLSWIDQLAQAFGAETVADELARAFADDTRVSTLIGRTQDRLRAGTRTTPQSKKPRVLEPWQEEQRAAYQAHYDSETPIVPAKRESA